MKLRIFQKSQCSAIIQPGEFIVDNWDNQQCSETNPMVLIRCEHCGKLFCSMYHWHPHLKSIGK